MGGGPFLRKTGELRLRLLESTIHLVESLLSIRLTGRNARRALALDAKFFGKLLGAASGGIQV